MSISCFRTYVPLFTGIDPKRIIGMYQAQMDKFTAAQEEIKTIYEEKGKK